MQDRNPELGAMGTKFFAYMQMKGLEIVHTGQLQKPFRISALQERKLLYRLNRSGLIFRLLRGVYLVPNHIPPGGFWRPNDYLIIARYMAYHKANYYIGGLTAFNKHGFSTQISNQLSVYNDKILGLKDFGGIKIKFYKIAKKYISGFDTLPIVSQVQTVNIANLAKTILDAINYNKRYQTLPEAYFWLQKYAHDKNFLKNFIELTYKTANNNATRRIGYFLEQLGVNKKTLLPLLEKLASTKGLVALVPNGSRQGRINKKWGIIDNAQNR
ncbi:MAG TPA: type IV toxin-antitoxin system AbiEi family antitoxin [Gammaproteobacteria bacterium]|nr:type IV toxin-antitoxin system AbiEi family antitoxin [Gammaproteobacteria bacterium]HRA43431.1 type IV toxin-antitoxin system AbiEi family antitoxin [Gammaproteobacteria bacterium]